jgi:diaminohydroxyphosphoribosylaminopyrimidine deaminase/5-amino-6-(5-phosphoribosylamino)uracil reductase
VIGVRDPHPRVDGEGIAILRAAGIEVIEGVAEAEIRRQLGPWIIEHHPHEPLRRAQTLPVEQLLTNLAAIYGVDRARIRALLVASGVWPASMT